MRDHDAQPVGGIARRLAAILTARGIDPAAPLIDPAEPIPALQAAQDRIPARYRAAVADHPAVAAWVREVAEAGRPGPEGAPGIAQVLIATQDEHSEGRSVPFRMSMAM
ncbi:hypothetical protein ACFTZF_15645 [Streptomyces mirabilis]|uniref:hypothetical protein n=1 Tax=Streptomyces mirabilis TaxID=68239 RepID=UPI0036267308